MILLIESIVLCAAFTLMVYVLSREPIKTLYNYPPAIQERVKSLDEYRDRIPTRNDKLPAKILAAVVIVIVFSLILRYINGYTTFWEGFGYGFLLWSIIYIYDAVVMDIIWFCHDPYFVFRGTEDMVKEYHDYWFHIRQSLIGEVIALVVCAAVGVVIQFLL